MISATNNEKKEERNVAQKMQSLFTKQSTTPTQVPLEKQVPFSKASPWQKSLALGLGVLNLAGVVSLSNYLFHPSVVAAKVFASSSTTMFISKVSAKCIFFSFKVVLHCILCLC